MTAPIQLFCGKSEPQKSNIQPIKNQIECLKAGGGIWTSTYNNESGSDWVRVYDSLWGIPKEGIDGWLLTPSSNSCVYKIDSLNDLIWMYQNYKRTLADIPDFIKMINFEKMAQDFDAVHLTAKGKSETRHSWPINLHAWDCECTHWFRWCFEKVEYIGKIKSVQIK
ncbi:hypothetical protein AB4672_21265 [Bacillus paralicheniformis]|uniref:hypothetical protein n=1 Tax=Bacillus paralicheniformis TaxID=1648923 RepID=UPI0034D3412D